MWRTISMFQVSHKFIRNAQSKSWHRLSDQRSYNEWFKQKLADMNSGGAAPSAPAQILSYTTPVLIYIADPISNEPLISLNNLDLPQFYSRWSTYKVREQTDAIKIPMGWRTFSKSFRYSNVSRWIVKSSLMFIDDAFTDLYYRWDLI